jgi:hypothetical protein
MRPSDAQAWHRSVARIKDAPASPARRRAGPLRGLLDPFASPLPWMSIGTGRGTGLLGPNKEQDLFAEAFRSVGRPRLHEVGFQIVDIAQLIFLLSFEDQFTGTLVRNIEVE